MRNESIRNAHTTRLNQELTTHIRQSILQSLLPWHHVAFSLDFVLECNSPYCNAVWVRARSLAIDCLGSPQIRLAIRQIKSHAGKRLDVIVGEVQVPERQHQQCQRKSHRPYDN
jgi:hypothetical protein